MQVSYVSFIDIGFRFYKKHRQFYIGSEDTAIIALSKVFAVPETAVARMTN